MPYFNSVKAPLAVCGLILLASSAFAAPLPSSTDDPQALAIWFADLGFRREGSQNEARVFEALRGWFGHDAPVEESGFEEMEGEHSFSRSLWFRIPGPAPGELIVVIPTDGENHRGLAWAVTWAREMLDRGAGVSITFLFTGAERGSGGASGLGSRRFLQNFYPTAPAAVLYLDAGTRDELELTTESGLFPSPLWMVRGLTEAFQTLGLEPRFTGAAPSLFRLDLPERKNVMAPWFERSIPAILVAGGPASRTVVRSLEAFVASLSAGVPDHWDRHYMVFDLGRTKLFWDQGTYIIVFLAVMGVLFFGYAVAGRGRRGSLRTLRSGFWQLPALFAFLFLALYAGDEVARLLQEARGFPEFWRSSPLLVWTFKALVAVTLSLFLFLPFRRSPLSRNPDFYSQAALSWLVIMVLVAAAFELSFSFYFLWALGWCAVLVVIRWPPIRLVAIVAGPLWLIKAAVDVMGSQPDWTLTRWALDSPVAGNVALAVLFFPFLLQIAAWHFSAKGNQNGDEGLRAAAQIGLLCLLTMGLGMTVLRSSPAVVAGNETTPVTVNLDDTPSELWSARVSRSAFLNRTVWNLRFTGVDSPEEVVFVLKSDQPLTIFDCSFPVTIDADGHRARIIVGRQPSLPLALRLTLPAQTQARLETRILFTGTPGLEAFDTVELNP